MKEFTEQNIGKVIKVAVEKFEPIELYAYGIKYEFLSTDDELTILIRNTSLIITYESIDKSKGLLLAIIKKLLINDIMSNEFINTINRTIDEFYQNSLLDGFHQIKIVIPKEDIDPFLIDIFVVKNGKYEPLPLNITFDPMTL